MQYKKIVKLLSLALCCSFVVSSLGGCGLTSEKKVFEPMEIEEVDTYSFDFIGGRNVMPITAYHGPQTYQYSAQGQTIPDYFTDDFFNGSLRMLQAEPQLAIYHIKIAFFGYHTSLVLLGNLS